jgi:hypothetical protein
VTSITFREFTMRHDVSEGRLRRLPVPPDPAAVSKEPKLRHQTQEPRARTLLGVLYFPGSDSNQHRQAAGAAARELSIPG